MPSQLEKNTAVFDLPENFVGWPDDYLVKLLMMSAIGFGEGEDVTLPFNQDLHEAMGLRSSIELKRLAVKSKTDKKTDTDTHPAALSLRKRFQETDVSLVPDAQATPQPLETQQVPAVSEKSQQRLLAERIAAELSAYSAAFWELVNKKEAEGHVYPNKNELFRTVITAKLRETQREAIEEGELHNIDISDRVTPYMNTLIFENPSQNVVPIPVTIGTKIVGEKTQEISRPSEGKLLIVGLETGQLQMFKRFVVIRYNREYIIEIYSKPIKIKRKASPLEQQEYYKEIDVDIIEKLIEEVNKGYVIKGLLPIQVTH